MGVKRSAATALAGGTAGAAPALRRREAQCEPIHPLENHTIINKKGVSSRGPL